MTDEFMSVFYKWMAIDPRTTVVLSIHLPLNLVMNLIHSYDKLHEIFPELPEVFIRFMSPFIVLKDKWGKVTNEEFLKEYREIYEAQFDSWFPNEEVKKSFEEWYKRGKK